MLSAAASIVIGLVLGTVLAVISTLAVVVLAVLKGLGRTLDVGIRNRRLPPRAQARCSPATAMPDWQFLSH